jgi:hypothetical protein
MGPGRRREREEERRGEEKGREGKREGRDKLAAIAAKCCGPDRMSPWQICNHAQIARTKHILAREHTKNILR